jgi:1-acyl-sn-glycerol-3-phosphate acyltransferase
MSAPPLAVPVLGNEVPQRGNALARGLASIALRLTGWHFVGDFPNAPKFVLIVAPHTSNWDFPVGLMAMFALGLRCVVLGKHTLFRWPFGPLMRWLGLVPVDRSSAHNVVFQTTTLFRTRDHMVLIVSPEGTRKRLPKWRTGFWFVARGAGVPIVPIAFDYSTKTFRLFPPLSPTEDRDADFATLRGYYRAGMAKHPDQYSS